MLIGLLIVALIAIPVIGAIFEFGTDMLLGGADLPEPIMKSTPTPSAVPWYLHYSAMDDK